MNYKLYKKEDFNTGSWIGGRTEEMVIFPPEGSYVDRNFVWRAGILSAQTDEADLPKLEDYDRTVTALGKETIISHGGERVVRLSPLETDSFDGSGRARIYGSAEVLDILVRKGCEASVDIVRPHNTAESFDITAGTRMPLISHLLFCHSGYAVVSEGQDSVMIREGQMLVISAQNGKMPSYQIMGEGALIRVCICYDEREGELGPEIIPAEKASFDDFRQCVFIANVQFRFAVYIFRRLRTLWFDEALSRAIRRVEKFYLTFLVFTAGVVAIAALLLNSGLSSGAIFGVIVLWIIADSLIVSPLIYMAFVPKPVRKHIKKVDELTPYERRVREAELNRNERVEKILRKYRNSGRVGKED